MTPSPARNQSASGISTVTPGAADRIGADRAPADSTQPDRKAGAGVTGSTSGQTPPVNNAGTSSSALPNGSSFALGSIAGFVPGGKYSDPEIVCALALDATNKVESRRSL